MDWRETTYSGSLCKQKNLTQIWGIYKIFSKKGFLDSMDLCETLRSAEISGSFCSQRSFHSSR